MANKEEDEDWAEERELDELLREDSTAVLPSEMQSLEVHVDRCSRRTLAMTRFQVQQARRVRLMHRENQARMRKLLLEGRLSRLAIILVAACSPEVWPVLKKMKLIGLTIMMGM